MFVYCKLKMYLNINKIDKICIYWLKYDVRLVFFSVVNMFYVFVVNCILIF